MAAPFGPAALPRLVDDRSLSHGFAVRAAAVGPAQDDDAAGTPGLDHTLVREIRREVSDRLAVALHAEPVTDPGVRRAWARSILSTVLQERARARVLGGEPAWSVGEELAVADAVMAQLFGLGRLQPLIDDPEVENIEVNGCDRVWVSYADGREEQVAPVADSDAELVELLQALVARTGNAERTFTTASPSLHLRLDDGSRLAAVAWTTPRPHVVIRRHRVRDVTLTGLVELGSLDPVLAEFLRAALLAGKNIVVTGLQNAGKTTLIRALAGEFDPAERFATIEREYELHLHEMPDRHPRVVGLQAREGSSERDASGRAAGEVSLADLVTDALRLNLRRIIVGEVRGDEVIPMLQAMSTGDGSLCTIHARSAGKAFERIVTLCLAHGHGMTDTFAYRLAAGAIDLVVHLTLRDDTAAGGRRHRYVSEVLEVDGIGEASRPATTTVFGPGPDGRAVPRHSPRCLPELERVGFDPTLLDLRDGAWTRPLPSPPSPRARSGVRLP